MQDSTGRYTYAYDTVDRKIMVALPSTQRMTYAFDAVGQRRSHRADRRALQLQLRPGGTHWLGAEPRSFRHHLSLRQIGPLRLRRGQSSHDQISAQRHPGGVCYDAANQTAEVGNLALSQ